MTESTSRAIEVEFFFAPDCSSCGAVRRKLRKAAEHAGVPVRWRDSNILENLDRAVELKLLRTPAVIVDGNALFRVPPGEAEFVAALLAARPTGQRGQN